MRFRFIHAADLHLDTPFRGIATVAPHVAQALREASLDALDHLFDLAIEREAAFVLLAGDIYDGPQRGIRAQLRLRRGLARLDQAGISCFIVHGNHDPLRTGWDTAQDPWPKSTTLFGAKGVTSAKVEKDGTTLATIHGISYSRPDETANLALGFRRDTQAGFEIGLLHCNVGDVSEHAPYAPCTVGDLAASRIDYWALGHIHARRILSEGDPWIVYPGNLQGRSMKPSELGPKGAMVVEVDHDRVVKVDFEPLDAVRFATVAVDISSARHLSDIEAALKGEATTLLGSSGGRPLVVRATLHGAGPAHEAVQRDAEGLVAALRDWSGSATPFVWWDAIVDHTRPGLDLDAIGVRGDFASEVLAMAQELAADPGRLEAFVARALSGLDAARLDRLGLSDYETDPATPVNPDDWARAIEVALEMLESDR